MAFRDVLEQYGVDVGVREEVYALLLRLPLAPRAKVAAWAEYLAGRGEVMTDRERAYLSA